jgi:hypothetical protein
VWLYTLARTPDSHGVIVTTVTPDYSYITEGTEVWLKVTPEINYGILQDSVRITGGVPFSADYNYRSGNDRYYTFTMPAYNATVAADFRFFSVGDTGPGGGKIFYADVSYVSTYYEAAPDDAVSLSPGPVSYDIRWSQNALAWVGTNTGRGYGRQNTDWILAATEPWDYNAAQSCDAYTYGSYNDWFLPSLEELLDLYNQQGVVGNLAAGRYWSSSEYSNSNAYFVDFSNGLNASEPKSTIYRVRPIRVFSVE